MGTQGTMVVETEQTVMLYPERGAAGRSMTMTVTTAGAGKPAVDSTSSTGPDPARAQGLGQAALGAQPASKGYREEMEHFAYCVRRWDESKGSTDRMLPRCHGRVAMADAIVALTSNLAMRRQQRIEFKHDWFDAGSADVPDPEMKAETITA